MPVDAAPISKSTVLVRNPDDPNTPISKQRDIYISHFATCPNSASHRTPKTKPAEACSAEKDTDA